MTHKESNIPEEYIAPLSINRLSGRVLQIPNKKKKRQIMLVYGHHSSIERYYGFAEDLSQYGSVTMPDLPGFGGMDSLYKIGEEATIDTLADYLAAVIKLKYKKERFSLAGFSIGFAIVTRMLQKYPDIAKQVELLISVAGFTHNEDFKFSSGTHAFYKYAANFFAGKWRATRHAVPCSPRRSPSRGVPGASPKASGVCRPSCRRRTPHLGRAPAR